MTRVTHARIAITASIVRNKVERAVFANIDCQTFATTELKYWEIVADKLSAAGFTWGYCSAVAPNGWCWIVDAHREGRRYIAASDELLSAFLELERVLLNLAPAVR